jgi:hypothetical protein
MYNDPKTVLEMCYRLMEKYTFKGRVEKVVKLKGLDLDTSKHHFTI